MKITDPKAVAFSYITYGLIVAAFGLTGMLAHKQPPVWGTLVAFGIAIVTGVKVGRWVQIHAPSKDR